MLERGSQKSTFSFAGSKAAVGLSSKLSGRTGCTIGYTLKSNWAWPKEAELRMRLFLS